MTEVEHPIVPEDVMALWEGQLTPDHAARVGAHVSGCAACQRIAHELGGVSHDMALWRVEEVPDTLRTPELRSLGRRAPSESPARRFWLPPVWQLAGSAVAVALVIVVVTFGGRAKAPTLSAGAGEAFILSGVEAPELSKGERVEEPSQTPRALGGQGQGQGQGQERQAASAAAPIRAALITRTAAMRIVASDFDAVRPAIDRVLADTGGFVGQIDASGDRGGPRSFRASVRIPAARLDAALAAFKGLGEVIAESQGADDVSEQVVDLDARLSNARNTERRLTELLRTRTGTVAGVLEVEREIARVRDVIERTEADRTNLGRRIRVCDADAGCRRSTKGGARSRTALALRAAQERVRRRDHERHRKCRSRDAVRDPLRAGDAAMGGSCSVASVRLHAQVPVWRVPPSAAGSSLSR